MSKKLTTIRGTRDFRRLFMISAGRHDRGQEGLLTAAVECCMPLASDRFPVRKRDAGVEDLKVGVPEDLHRFIRKLKCKRKTRENPPYKIQDLLMESACRYMVSEATGVGLEESHLHHLRHAGMNDLPTVAEVRAFRDLLHNFDDDGGVDVDDEQFVIDPPARETLRRLVEAVIEKKLITPGMLLRRARRWNRPPNGDRRPDVLACTGWFEAQWSDYLKKWVDADWHLSESDTVDDE